MSDVNTFNFELVSPEKKLLSEQAWQVTIPGEEGTFGVRAGHMSLLATIRPGVIEVVRTQGAAPDKIFIAGGFADVTADNCTVLAEHAINVKEINPAALQADLDKLSIQLSAANDAEKPAIERKIQLTKETLKAAS